MPYEEVLPIWWGMFWRTSLIGMLVGFFLGGIGGSIAGISGHLELAPMVGAIMGYLGGIPVSIWALKAALDKNGVSKN